MKNHYQILIVGGGNAGLSVASQLLIKNSKLDIGIIEPSEKHYYQPAWTLVAGGVFDIQKTERTEASVMPKGADWVKDRVIAFEPEQNTVVLEGQTKLSYDFLIVAPGIQLNWKAVKGLEDALGKNGVTSNYSFKHAPYTFELIKNLKKGKAIFHNPHTPVKCGGAPHKIMYLAADYFRKHGVLKDISIQYWSGGSKLFALPTYEQTLMQVVKRNNIQLNFYQRLEEIDGANKRARFVGFGENNKNIETWVDYDMIHVTPPQSAPDFIRNSPIVKTPCNTPHLKTFLLWGTLQGYQPPKPGLPYANKLLFWSPIFYQLWQTKRQVPVMVVILLAQLLQVMANWYWLSLITTMFLQKLFHSTRAKRGGRNFSIRPEQREVEHVSAKSQSFALALLE